MTYKMDESNRRQERNKVHKRSCVLCDENESAWLMVSENKSVRSKVMLLEQTKESKLGYYFKKEILKR